MTILLACCFFGLGLFLGSFYNVVGLRISFNEPIFTGLFCEKPITGLNSLSQIVTGLLFLWVYLRFGLTIEGLIGLVLVSLVVITSISDLKYMLIPNQILLFFLPVISLLIGLYPLHTLWSYLCGSLIGGGIILLIVIVTHGGMGMGDAKLFFLCGLIVGSPYILLALFIACLIATIVGIILLLLKIVKHRQPIPFGPFLALGTLITYGYGSDIVQLYLAILNTGM